MADKYKIWKDRRKSFERFRSDVEKLHDEIDLIKGRLKQAETIELDLSVLDDKIEENTQQLFAAFREKVYELSKRMGDLEEDMNLLEEKLEENQTSSNSEE